MERKAYKFWFATGSQDLYGDECLRKVAEHSGIIVEGLNRSGLLPYEVIWKPTLIDNTSIRPSPGFSAFRSTESLCFIYIRSLIRRFPMTPLTWIS